MTAALDAEAVFIGIDVGGTKIAAGAVRAASGQVGLRREIRTPAADDADAIGEAIAWIAGDVTAAAGASGDHLVAIGVGLPELVTADGEIGTAYLCDWRRAGIGHRLGSIAPVLATSDVRAAALAEARFGAGQDLPLFAYVSIGTGIGSTIVVNGQPVVGAHGGAVVFASGALAVPCGQPGEWTDFALETYSSGAAIAQRYLRATGNVVDGAREVIAAADRGDMVAAEIVESAARALGSGIAWLVNLLDPHAIVFGGGLGLAPGRFRTQLVTSARQSIWNPQARDVAMLPGRLGADAGIVGAAAIARESMQIMPRARDAASATAHRRKEVVRSGALHGA